MKYRQFFHNDRKSLQRKLFSSYFYVSLLILAAFTLTFYIFVSRMQMQNELQKLQDVNSHFLSSVDSILDDLDSASVNINYSNLLVDSLTDSFDLDLEYSSAPELAALLVTINGADIKADQINLYDLNGKVMRCGILTGIYNVDIDSLEWTDAARESGGIKLISQPYSTKLYSTNTHKNEWYISLYRVCRNQYGRFTGYIETVKRCKSLFKTITANAKTSEHPPKVYIFDSTGALIYPYEPDDSILLESDHYYKLYQTSPSSSLIRSPQGEAGWLVYETSAYSGWTCISLQSQSVILAPIRRMLMLLMAFTAFALLTFFLLSRRLARSMILPIKHLKHRIMRLEISNLGQEKDEYSPGYQELEELYTAFENMSRDLNRSMSLLVETREQEANSRALALQAQINPHFYYNTLASIIVLAENEQPKEVITLCRKLTSIMRYITNTSTAQVSLAVEMDYIRQYLYCMQVRYQDSLQVNIHIPDEIASEQIPKLLIQPIVENALKYGTNTLPPWQLTITGRSTPDHWEISVIDSGTGFTSEAIHTIREKIAQADNRLSGLPSMKIDGLGLVNVYARWKLLHQDRIIFTLGNTPEGHGIVTIGLHIRDGSE